jgi:hypothetical protein
MTQTLYAHMNKIKIKKIAQTGGQWWGGMKNGNAFQGSEWRMYTVNPKVLMKGKLLHYV